jgi:hypothetical protein
VKRIELQDEKSTPECSSHDSLHSRCQRVAICKSSRGDVVLEGEYRKSLSVEKAAGGGALTPDVFSRRRESK